MESTSEKEEKCRGKGRKLITIVQYIERGKADCMSFKSGFFFKIWRDSRIRK